MTYHGLLLIGTVIAPGYIHYRIDQGCLRQAQRLKLLKAPERLKKKERKKKNSFMVGTMNAGNYEGKKL